MNLRAKILISSLILSAKVYSQNLVPNPSFEDTIPCSQWPSTPPGPITYWFAPIFISTPDWFAAGTICSDQTPSNILGFQFPRTGIAYAGFAANGNYQPPPFSTREYISCQLTQPLQQNKSYCVGFYISRAEKMKYSLDGMGAYFSTDTPTCAGNFCLLQYTPQISNATGNILSDSINWVLISGSFIASGGEKFITIGNFVPDSLNSIDSISIWTYPHSYYYIDDVYVIELPQDSTSCFDGVGVEEIKKEEEFLLFPNPVSNELSVICYQVSDKSSMTIYNLLGEKVYEQETLLPKTEINLSSQPEGIYLLTLKNKEKIFSQKFIISR